MKLKTHKFCIVSILIILAALRTNAQLGFCNGNSGDPIFTEDFGSGTNYGPALPAGTTTYNFIGNSGPQDGQYTIGRNTFSYGWNLPSDHTGDTNGKCLIVNANFSVGEFYRTSVSGLCENTTYEFSSWLINILPSSGCSGNGIPVNVKFEIWDNTDTNLLASGDTGNIFGTSAPTWEEYGLVFQTLAGQTSVILKMINNGLGGCGNDLAIDDIVFKSCGDFILVEDAGKNNNIAICSSQTPYSTTITAVPDGSVFNTHFYQWQESLDGLTWLDVPGQTNQSLSVSGVANTTYFRSKVSESVVNLNNSKCNTLSDVFQITVNQAPSIPVIECWETATFNETTCSWEITGTQAVQPTIECWETAIFNDTTCLWEVSGTQPVQPVIECWQTTTFNSTTCVWDVTGTQPAQPVIACWQTAIFNDTTCLWEISGTQPTQPVLDCWEIATFNDTSCSWEVSGTQPAQPAIECWQTTTFNSTTCVWEVIGTKPTQPVIECWETATFNGTICLWEVTGTPPSAPIVECWETATFNNTTCLWEVTGTRPGEIYEDDFFICNGTSLLLEANTSISNPEYMWNTGDSTDTIEVDTPGLYSVEITSSTSCVFETRNFNIIEAEIPLIEKIASDENNIVVETLNSGDFLYSLDGNIFQTSNVFRNVEGGLYTIYVKNQYCSNIVNQQHLHFYIPKFFTPNNDGENDTFNLSGMEYFSSSYISIFDRFGKLLKSSQNPQFSWDGTYNGQPMPSSDYWYVIVIDSQKFAGHFTLIR